MENSKTLLLSYLNNVNDKRWCRRPTLPPMKLIIKESICLQMYDSLNRNRFAISFNLESISAQQLSRLQRASTSLAYGAHELWAWAFHSASRVVKTATDWRAALRSKVRIGLAALNIVRSCAEVDRKARSSRRCALRASANYFCGTWHSSRLENSASRCTRWSPK